MSTTLCASLLSKIIEQIERTNHLLCKLPPEKLEWSPAIQNSWPTARVVGHLLDCLAGFCAVLAAVNPERLAHFQLLRTMPVNHACPPSEAAVRLAHYKSHINEGFALLSDEDLARLIPTVFVASGETVLTLLLGNMEHLINHKHQLFTYMRLMEIEVSTMDLYCFRPVSSPGVAIPIAPD